MIVLDTDCLGIYQQRTMPEYNTLKANLERHAGDKFTATIVSFHEQVTGWLTYLNRAKKPGGVQHAYAMFQRLLRDLSVMTILPFDAQAAQEFETLKKKRVRIGTLDLRIASCTLANDATLVSRNLVDFCRVPNLRVEDWTIATR